MKAGHSFNLLDARGAISVTERAAYIGRVRVLARAVAQSYLESRARLGFPMADAAIAAGVLGAAGIDAVARSAAPAGIALRVARDGSDDGFCRLRSRGMTRPLLVELFVEETAAKGAEEARRRLRRRVARRSVGRRSGRP